VIHAGSLKHLVPLAASVLAIAGTGLIGTATMAMAATASGTATSANAQLKTGNFSYACNFSGYGGGTAPIDVATSLSVPDSAALDSNVAVTFATQAAALPAAVSKVLPALDSIQLDAGSATVGTNIPTLGFTASSGPVAAGATQIPAITASSGRVTFVKTGYASITLPASLTLTPFAGGKALTAISCTPAGPVTPFSLPIAVTTPPGTVVGNYLCGVPVGQPLTPYEIPVRITVTGPAKVGATDSVRLNVPSPAAAAGAGGPSVQLKGSVSVTGAQHGSIAVAGTDSRTASSLSAAGKLVLTAAGKDHISLPTAFQVIDPTGGPTFAIFFCTLSGTPSPTGASLTVGATAPAPATASASPVPSATPAGAPATGGGSGPGTDVALAIAGAVSLAAGTAMVLMAFLRRKAHQSVV
jgi:hypothetical protein